MLKMLLFPAECAVGSNVTTNRSSATSRALCHGVLPVPLAAPPHQVTVLRFLHG